MHSTEKPLRRAEAARGLKHGLRRLGVDPARYNTHSFRAGRATDLALAGAFNQVIKASGRCSSDAYMQYVRLETLSLPPAQASAVGTGVGGGVSEYALGISGAGHFVPFWPSIAPLCPRA